MSRSYHQRLATSAETNNYELSPEEQALYAEVTDYVRDEMNRAERFAVEAGDDRRRVNVGFALTILQRRLASSPEAIYRSLTRRRERLDKRLADETSSSPGVSQLPRNEAMPRLTSDYLDDLEDAPEIEVEEAEERILDQATAAATVAELRTEIETLKRLEERARKVRFSGTDTKWTELSTILDDPLMTDEEGNRRKLIIFTEVRRLQPHFVHSFFLEAFKHLGGTIHKREPGRYEIRHVPGAIRERARRFGHGMPVQRSYERIYFEKDRGEGLPPTAFVCPGHPLLDATIDLILERYRDLLKRGAVLVDESDAGDEARALVYFEHAVQDGRTDRDGKGQIVSKRLQFVEMDREGDVRNPGPAPYLDYRPLREEERPLLEEALEEPWLRENMEERVMGYAIGHLAEQHVAEVREQRLSLIDKVEREVEARLKTQINYWDRRAQELKAREREGKRTRLSSQNAAATAEDLADRLDRRREILEKERQISALPPIVRGGAVVLPGGLVRRLTTPAEAAFVENDPDVLHRQEIERLAMRAVEEAERNLGRIPRDVSAERGIGYDIESKDSKTGTLYFIEVKGKWEGKDDLTLTKNEILCSRNEPEKFRLAIVVVGEDGSRAPRYLKGYDFGEPVFAQTATTFSLRKLLGAAGEPT